MSSKELISSFDLTPKAQRPQKKQIGLYQNENVCDAKDINKVKKKNPQSKRKYLQILYLNKGLISWTWWCMPTITTTKARGCQV